MPSKVIITTDQIKLFDFISKSKDQEVATDFIGRRLVSVVLGGEASFAERIGLAMAGIEVEIKEPSDASVPALDTPPEST